MSGEDLLPGLQKAVLYPHMAEGEKMEIDRDRDKETEIKKDRDREKQVVSSLLIRALIPI